MYVASVSVMAREKREGLTPEQQRIFAKNARAFRVAAGFKNRQAAATQSGTSLDLVKKYETEGDVTNPDGTKVRKLAAAYGQTSDDFYAAQPGPMTKPQVVLAAAFHPLFEIPPEEKRRVDEEIARINQRLLLKVRLKEAPAGIEDEEEPENPQVPAGGR